MKYTVTDLFSGCGGLSQGFHENGFEIRYGVDIQEDFLKTFEHNFENSKTLKLDLSDPNSLDELEYTDVVLAGPPCQGFSLTGPRNLNDPRNKLYMAVFDYINKFKPKAFLVENVKGLMTMWKGEVFEKIIEKFNSLDYEITYMLIKSEQYGLPQARHRVFIIGIRKDFNKKFKFPIATHGVDEFIGCEEAMGDLPSLSNSLGFEPIESQATPKTVFQKYVMDSNEIYNHIGTLHKQFVIDTIKLVPEGGNHKDLPPGVGESRKFNEAWTRYHSKKPSKTIDTGHRNHFHYKWNRVPTVRENARLQSFKDSFRFLGTKTSQNTQVGNAVPPLISNMLAKEILKLINEKN